MEDPDKKAELQRLINEAPVTPAKPSMLKNPTDPPTHVSVEDAPTGKWHHFLQTLHVTSRCATSFLKIIFFIFFIFLHCLIAPGSATKLLQEESKQEMPKHEETKQEVPK